MAGIALPYLGRERLVCAREGFAVRVHVRSRLANSDTASRWEINPFPLYRNDLLAPSASF
jgi:hypothetical protein